MYAPFGIALPAGLLRYYYCTRVSTAPVTDQGLQGGIGIGLDGHATLEDIRAIGLMDPNIGTFVC